MDVNLLRYHMKVRGDSHEALATHLGIAKSTLYSKMGNKLSEFTQGEINKIVQRYELRPEEVMKIFFTPIILIK